MASNAPIATVNAAICGPDSADVTPAASASLTPCASITYCSVKRSRARSTSLNKGEVGHSRDRAALVADVGALHGEFGRAAVQCRDAHPTYLEQRGIEAAVPDLLVEGAKVSVRLGQWREQLVDNGVAHA